MKVIALEIPDEPAKLPGWLEQRLVGLDLAELVAELEAVHGPSASDGPRELDAVFGDRREAVLREGLAALPRESLRTLLKRPRLLVELQELALVEGGEHWQRLLQMSDDLRAPVEESRRRLGKTLSSRKDAAPPWKSRASTMSRRLWVGGGMAAAASAVVGFAVWQQGRNEIVVASAAWGWSLPEALSQDATPSAYLTRLADLADEWFDKRPESGPALVTRINEFRKGCKVILTSTHRPLSPADRQWLLDKCRDWDAKFAALEAEAASGKDSRAVRDQADAMVRRLMAALRERAKLV